MKNDVLYALGGIVVGGLAGTLISRRGTSAPSDIQKQADKITAYIDGNEMTMKAIINFKVGTLPAVLYGFYSGEDINGLMSVYISGTVVEYECAKMADSGVDFYRDGDLMLTISGGAANRKEYAA